MAATELTERLLSILRDDDDDGFDTEDVAVRFGIDHQQIVGAVKSLQSRGVINCEPRYEKRWRLTEEGASVARDGSCEALVYYAVPPEDGITRDALSTVGDATTIGFGRAIRLGWITRRMVAAVTTGKEEDRVYRNVSEIQDETQNVCRLIEAMEAFKLTDREKADCKRRKLATETNVCAYRVTKGADFLADTVVVETDLTAEMIASGSWRTKAFKAYNFDSLGSVPPSGHLHPLLKVRAQFRQTFLEMGFVEMATNNFVESSFWNFDALFQPQQHPARDAHDTFFVAEPATTARPFPVDYAQRVQTVHAKGGYGSRGYAYEWKMKEATKNVLRTHTTAVSARALYALAQRREFTPVKYFSIDRVFRNETLDATHLAEFHQIEGLVADYGLTLGHLMGYIETFFSKCGMSDVRFKPAYNPYTEPSMEIFAYHPSMKRWIEVGNSGMFRPEMLLPMGLPPSVVVIAWGLSLERPTMIKYDVPNIRQLFGPKVDLQTIRDCPICRLEKNDASRDASSSSS